VIRFFRATDVTAAMAKVAAMLAAQTAASFSADLATDDVMASAASQEVANGHEAAADGQVSIRRIPVSAENILDKFNRRIVDEFLSKYSYHNKTKPNQIRTIKQHKKADRIHT
jgi:hypothetical protein